MHDVVALLEEVPAKDFSTARPLLLHRGQIGTVVRIYPDGACEVELARPGWPGVRNIAGASGKLNGSTRRS